MPMVSMQLRRVSAKHGGSYTKQRYSRQVLITNLPIDIMLIIGKLYGLRILGHPAASRGDAVRPRRIVVQLSTRRDAVRRCDVMRFRVVI